MACPNFIKGKNLCSYLLEKFGGKEDLAVKGCHPYNSNECSYERDAYYYNCPQYKEQKEKLK